MRIRSKVIELIPSTDGKIRSVSVEMSIPVEPDTIDKENLGKKDNRRRTTTVLERPVQKICILPVEPTEQCIEQNESSEQDE